jgi:SpoVK/Ycf46/Vps4 family AAA+-type ATPase
VREIPEPSKESREVILRYFVRKHSLALTPADTEIFLERSDGFSPADVKEFCETVKAVGVPQALDELSRIAAQRELYSGDRCQEFNQDRVRPRPRRRTYPMRY